MTPAKHTPGPWHVSPTHLGNAIDIGAADGSNIALVSGPAENGADEFKANARLIAAAPELLTDARQCAMELEEVAKILRPTHPSLAGIYDAAANRTRALIAKAAG